MSKRFKIELPDPLSIPLPEDVPLPASSEHDNPYMLDPCDIPQPPSPPPLPPIDEVPLPEDTPMPPSPPRHSVTASLSKTSTASHHVQPTASTTSEKTRRRRKRGVAAREEEDGVGVGGAERDMMAKMMGFTSFDSTKGKMVPGNQVGAVHVVKKRRYRQYMNRKGGFNRPLDKVA